MHLPHDIFAQQKKAFFKALRDNDTPTFLSLLETAPTLLNASDEFSGLTALQFAIIYKNPSAAQILLQRGADLQPGNALMAPMIESVLHLAAIHDMANIITMLIARGLHVDLAGNERRTPLHYAALSGKISSASSLLDHQANINALTLGGHTPLDMAIQLNQPDMARWLRAHGAMHGPATIMTRLYYVCFALFFLLILTPIANYPPTLLSLIRGDLQPPTEEEIEEDAMADNPVLVPQHFEQGNAEPEEEDSESLDSDYSSENEDVPNNVESPPRLRRRR